MKNRRIGGLWNFVDLAVSKAWHFNILIPTQSSHQNWTWQKNQYFISKIACSFSEDCGANNIAVLNVILNLIGAKDDGGGGDIQSYKTCKAPVKSPLTTNQYPFFTGAGCHSCRPTNSVGIFHRLAHPKLTWEDLSTLSLTTKGSWLPLGRVAKHLISLVQQYSSGQLSTTLVRKLIYTRQHVIYTDAATYQTASPIATFESVSQVPRLQWASCRTRAGLPL